MKKAFSIFLAGLCLWFFTGNVSLAGVLSVRGKALGPDGLTPLPGNGLPITGPEGYVQCLYAGAGGTVDNPNPDGSAGGDDVLLETAEYPGQFFTAVGEGFPFNPAGRFFEDFTHSLPAAARVYVRVWNGEGPAGSTHYGDSPLYALVSDNFDEHDFGQWSTTTPLTAACVDLDGDGYGNPAADACPHPQLDCNDANPNVNPGKPEVSGNGLDDDCNPNTPTWGTPMSVVPANDEGRLSDRVNALLLLVVPVSMVLIWRRARSRRR